ncbi:hypothetical protein [Flavobacterium algicola]|uniref:hypothetical protein n=1 Tax=Flavobacterium algicola TaxID=556529 RepID=UPI001EFED9C6|nr:hypothetical protein [Flavobacterium algicola]MCG9792460.1 hypothetical protein [Flavobacterium algicola]
MNTLEKINKKIIIPYSLKHYFSSSSHEYARIEYAEKIALLQSVVQKGFSTYDLSEAFREPRATKYSQYDMQKELVRYIVHILYGNVEGIIVNRYYEGVRSIEAAKDLDAYLLSEDPYEDFKMKFKEKFNIAL